MSQTREGQRRWTVGLTCPMNEKTNVGERKAGAGIYFLLLLGPIHAQSVAMVERNTYDMICHG